MAFQQIDNSVITPATYRAGGVWHNPGRDEAIAGLVLAFFFPILGLILGVMSMNRSRRFGWPTEGIAKAAVWLSVLLVILGVVSWFFIRRGEPFSPELGFIRNLWWV